MKKLNLAGLTVGRMVGRVNYREIKSNVVAYDTETYNGICTLIANSDKKYLIVKDYKELLKFLTSKKKSDLNFFFNLEYDTNAIIKTFPYKNILELANFNHTILGYYDIFIVKKKALIITKYPEGSIIDNDSKEGKKFKYFDIAQFYQMGSLEKTFNKLFICGDKGFKCNEGVKLGKYIIRLNLFNRYKCNEGVKCDKCLYYNEVLKLGGFIKALDASKQFPLEKITQEDINYCIGDCIATQKISDYFVKTTHKILPVQGFYSPASLGKYMIRLNLFNRYKFNNKGNVGKIQGIAYQSYNGGRFETSRIGKFSGYQYDINSAYPSALYDIPNLNGHIIYDKKYQEHSTHSFFKCNFKLEKKQFYLSPIRYQYKNMLVYPDGEFKDAYLSKCEYELLNKLGIRIHIKEATHIMNDEPIYPFKFIKDVYDLRIKYKHSKISSENALTLPLKLAMNSIYGLTIMTTKKYKFREETNNEEITMIEEEDINNLVILKCKNCSLEYNFETLSDNKNICQCGSNTFQRILVTPDYVTGEFFNPIVASEITGKVRCKLYSDIIGHEDSIYMFATDSITTDKKLSLPISEILGEYSDTPKIEGVIFGTGIYSLHSLDDKIHKVRFRGFSKKDMLNIAKDNLETDIYTENITRPIKLKESVIQKKLGIDRMNIFSNFSKDFNINFDVKRNWNRKAVNFKDLLENQIDSVPKNIQTDL